MDIEQIKQKLAQVGLPVYGTDEELVERAELNGLVEKRDRAAEALLADKTKEQLEQGDTTPLKVNTIEPRRGRPRGS